MHRARLTVGTCLLAVLIPGACGCGYFGYEPIPISRLDGAPDASPTVDAGSDGGNLGALDGSVPCASAIVCTTFDDTSGFSTFESSGLVQIVSGVLDTQTTAPGGYASLVATFPAITSGTLHFRGHMRIVGSFTVTDVNPWMIGNRFETDFGMDFDLVGGGKLRLNPSSGVSSDSTITLARDTWLCIQGSIVLGDTGGSVEVRSDGTTLVTQSNIDTLPPNGVQHVSIGIDWTSAAQANTRIQWDDFVLARTPVPCN